MPMNVVLITPDQLRWDALGCNGNRVVKTPRLDALAEESIRFEQCHVHNWVCVPSRATILTGAHPSVHGVLFNEMDLDRRFETIADVFRAAGYRTGHVGKWHHYPGGESFGFETVLAHHGYRDYLRENGIDPDLAKEYGPGWTRDHATWISPIPAEHYLTSYETEQAMRYVDSCGSDPFFLWLSHEKPHLPFNPPEEYASMYELDEIPLPVGWAGVDEGGAPHKRMDSQHHWRTGMRPGGMTDGEIRRTIAYYYASISLIDANVGKLLDHLGKKGLRERTLVVFSSDHGEMLGEHRLLNKGAYPYDALTRVPLIINDPRSDSNGEVEKRLAGQEDVIATLLAEPGLRRPEHMMGRNLLDVEESAGTAIGVSGHHYGPCYNVNVRTWRTGKYRYNVYDYLDDVAFEELYDLSLDPHECHNLIHHTNCAETVDRLREGLLKDTMKRDHARREVIGIRESFSGEDPLLRDHDFTVFEADTDARRSAGGATS